MKKVVLVAMFGLLVAGNYSFGQDHPIEKGDRDLKSPIEKAEKRTEKMKADLDLSDEQAEEINKINLFHIQEMEEIKKKMDALREEANQKREEHQEEINKVLSDEQRVIKDQKMAERVKKREEHKKQCNHEH